MPTPVTNAIGKPKAVKAPGLLKSENVLPGVEINFGVWRTSFKSLLQRSYSLQHEIFIGLTCGVREPRH